MTIGFARAALVLGLVSLGGPVAIDTYLPAMPSIADELAASPTAVQMSLMAFFVALTVSQPVYGPLADMFGRRRPLLFGLGFYVVGGIGCAFATSIEMLVAMRFVQGVGACAGMVIPRAVVRDLYTGIPATRLMALIMLILGIGPMLAPFVGSLINAAFGWRVIFLGTAAIGFAGIALVLTNLPETRDREKQAASTVGTALRNYGELLRDPHFLALSVMGGAGLAGFFTFVAGSPFVYIEHFGLDPTVFAMAFSVNAFGFFTVTQLAASFGARFGLRGVARTAIYLYCTVMVALAAYFLAGGGLLPVMMVGLFVGFSTLGLVLPTTTVLALDRYGHAAGTASSLMGTIQFGMGALATLIMSVLGEGDPVTMLTTITAFGCTGALMAALALRGGSQPEAA